MFSRTTLWRRKKRLKELFSRIIASTNSPCDEKYMLILLLTYTAFFISFSWLDPILSETSNNIAEVDLLTQKQSLNLSESQSYLFTSINDDKSEDEPDMFVDQTWLEESVDNIDPWKNIEFEPKCQYSVEDNEFLLRDTSR